MKKLVLAFAGLLTISLSCTKKDPLHLQSLDKVIEERQLYDAAYDRMQDSLRIRYLESASDSRKWEEAYRVQKHYFYHNLDSCYRYCMLMISHSEGNPQRLADSQSNYANCLFRMDSVQRALSVLESILPQYLSKEGLSTYYLCGYHIYRTDDVFAEKQRNLIKRWWASDSTSVQPVYYCSQHDSSHDIHLETIRRLHKCQLLTPNDTAKALFYLAREYKAVGQTYEAIKYYSLASQYDIKISVKAYSALYELSQMLFDEGQIDRANRYMRITLSDTRFSGYRLHYDAITQSTIQTMDVVSRQRDERRKMTTISLIVVSVLFVLIFFLAILLKRNYNSLESSHAQVLELSKIKDVFLANYMEKSVDYLNKVDDYRSSLRQAMKTEGQDAVKAMLRKPSYAAGEFSELLDMFDKSFLGIFPNFVEQVNRHMQPQWQLEQPEEGKLSMELRVLALIRMGITKRKRIARALNLSVTTVYSYHYNLHKHSRHADEDFDAIIAGL